MGNRQFASPPGSLVTTIGLFPNNQNRFPVKYKSPLYSSEEEIFSILIVREPVSPIAFQMILGLITVV